MKEKGGITKLARKLRRDMTSAESLLWQELRNRKLGNFKFNRQFPVIYREILGKKEFFILDFYCSERKIAVELDGPIHDKQTFYDATRDQILNELGIKVLRYKNEEVKQMGLLLEKILNEMNG